MEVRAAPLALSCHPSALLKLPSVLFPDIKPYILGKISWKKLSMFKGQFYVYPIFEVFIVEWDYIL